MMNFTVEETNLIAIYQRGTRVLTLASLTENRPYMDVLEMQPIMDSCVKKLSALTEDEFAGLLFEALAPELFSEAESEAK